MPPTGAELWDGYGAADRAMTRLLAQLKQHGAMSRDQLCRHCLSPEQLLPLVPRRELLTMCCEDRQTLIEALEISALQPGGNAALRGWHDLLERTRTKVSWLFFPASMRRLCRRRADWLTAEAEQRGWIEHLPGDDLWLITCDGLAALSLRGTSRSMIY